MGMSASQARLLSITARLTNNEYQSQMLTNSKLRLATETDKATNKYMNALDSQQLMYCNYDDTGAATKVQLTPALMYEYAPMKNQYSLINNSGKMLVSSLDAKNYNETNTLEDFLRCYNLVDDVSKEERNPAYDAWVINHYNWELSEPQQSDYQKDVYIKTGEEWVYTDSEIYDAIANISCFSYTKNGQRCYMHVLSALLGRGQHTTSDGHTFTVEREEDIGWQWNSCTDSEAATMDGLREKLKSDPVSTEGMNGYVTPRASSHGSSVHVNGSGGTGNCYQKCVDMLWRLHWNYDGSSTGGTASQEELDEFWFFVECDLSEKHKEDIGYWEKQDDVEAFNEAHANWVNSEPPEVSEVIESTSIVINDSEKGQWYTNLCTNKDISKSNFDVFDDRLYTSAEWLQFALEEGILRINQATLTSPAENSGKLLTLDGSGITWNSIVYTNARDMVYVDNEKAIAIAEVEYTKTVKEIEAKDKKYDSKM